MDWYGNYFMYDPQRFLPLTPFEAQVFVLDSGCLHRVNGLPPSDCLEALVHCQRTLEGKVTSLIPLPAPPFQTVEKEK